MITPGTILIEKGTPLPDFFRVGDGTHLKSWMPVKHSLTPQELDKELAAAGWTFFYIAGEIRTTAFGFDRDRMMNAALKRLLADVRLLHANSIQIDGVARRSFLGLPYVSVSAHSRHLQKGQVFSGHQKQEGAEDVQANDSD